MDGRLTIATTPQHICAGQKGGWGSVTEKDLIELSDIAMSKGNDLRALLPE